MLSKLSGLELIQPELKQARQAIDRYELVDAEFKEWDGEGNPPAGTACELRVLPHGEWGAAMICFSSDNVIVWDWAEEPAANGKCTSYTHQVDARPVRSSEQIETEERDRQAKEMLDLLKPGEELGRNFFRRLYDKGFRKQVAP